MKAKREGVAGMPTPVRPGSKLSRDCVVCGVKPYTGCRRWVSGKYSKGTGRGDDGNGGYWTTLKQPHKGR